MKNASINKKASDKNMKIFYSDQAIIPTLLRHCKYCGPHYNDYPNVYLSLRKSKQWCRIKNQQKKYLKNKQELS